MNKKENQEIEKLEEILTPLLELEGVALPTASAILAMKYPKNFAIIDSFVLEGMKKYKKIYKKLKKEFNGEISIPYSGKGKDIWYRKCAEKYFLYLQYILYFHKLKGNKELRKTEKELWIHGHKKNIRQVEKDSKDNDKKFRKIHEKLENDENEIDFTTFLEIMNFKRNIKTATDLNKIQKKIGESFRLSTKL